jgi:hypothetical protein
LAIKSVRAINISGGHVHIAVCDIIGQTLAAVSNLGKIIPTLVADTDGVEAVTPAVSNRGDTVQLIYSGDEIRKTIVTNDLVKSQFGDNFVTSTFAVCDIGGKTG